MAPDLGQGSGAFVFSSLKNLFKNARLSGPPIFSTLRFRFAYCLFFFCLPPCHYAAHLIHLKLRRRDIPISCCVWIAGPDRVERSPTACHQNSRLYILPLYEGSNEPFVLPVCALPAYVHTNGEKWNYLQRT